MNWTPLLGAVLFVFSAFNLWFGFKKNRIKMAVPPTVEAKRYRQPVVFWIIVLNYLIFGLGGLLMIFLA